MLSQSPWREGSQGFKQARNLEGGAEAEALEGAANCWLAHNGLLVTESRTTSTGPAPPTGGCWAFPHQLLTEKMPYWLACSQILGRHFLN